MQNTADIFLDLAVKGLFKGTYRHKIREKALEGLPKVHCAIYVRQPGGNIWLADLNSIPVEYTSRAGQTNLLNQVNFLSHSFYWQHCCLHIYFFHFHLGSLCLH